MSEAKLMSLTSSWSISLRDAVSPVSPLSLNTRGLFSLHEFLFVLLLISMHLLPPLLYIEKLFDSAQHLTLFYSSLFHTGTLFLL